MKKLIPDPSTLEWRYIPEWDQSETDRFLLHDGTEWIAEAHFVDAGDGIPRLFFHLEVWKHTPSNLKTMLRMFKEWRVGRAGLRLLRAREESPALVGVPVDIRSN